MARLNTFYLAPEAWPDTGRASLSAAESAHLFRVLRHKPGDTVRLFDGQGRYGLFEIVEASKHETKLASLEVFTHPRPSSPLTLALGWNKSSRRDWLLEKSVELGATQLLFWQADRSQGTIPAVPKPRWTDRMIQAAKQCGATWLPTVNTLNSIDEVIFSAKTYDQCLLLWESPSATTLLSPDMLAQGKTIAVFGPEGGLEDKETTQFMTKGFTSVSLGSTILRWETAALHCLSLAHFARQSG